MKKSLVILVSLCGAGIMHASTVDQCVRSDDKKILAQLFEEAVRNDDSVEVSLLVEYDKSLVYGSSTDEPRLPMLHYALWMECNVAIIKIMVDAILEDEQADGVLSHDSLINREVLSIVDDITTPLHLVFCFEIERGVYTIKQRADRYTKYGHQGYYANKCAVISLLIQKGAQFNARTSKGSTFMHIVTSFLGKQFHDSFIYAHFSQLLKDLVKLGAPVHACDAYGNTPLSILEKSLVLREICEYMKHRAL